MKNERTPRTLADASFQTGYAQAAMQTLMPTTNRIAGVLLAVALGVFAALFLLHYAAK